MCTYTCVRMCVCIFVSVNLPVYPCVEHLPLPTLSLPFPFTAPFLPFLISAHHQGRQTQWVCSGHPVAVVLSVCGDSYTHNVTPSPDSSDLSMHSIGQCIFNRKHIFNRKGNYMSPFVALISPLISEQQWKQGLSPYSPYVQDPHGGQMLHLQKYPWCSP